jgi:hypothetical protein
MKKQTLIKSWIGERGLLVIVVAVGAALNLSVVLILVQHDRQSLLGSILRNSVSAENLSDKFVS